MSEKNYIIIYNSSFEFDDKKLCPDELFVYAYLYRNRIYKDRIVVSNIDLIDQCLEYVFVKGNSTTNKRYIKNVLISLRTKGYIFFDDVNSWANNSALRISMRTEKGTGYSSLNYDKFDVMEDPIKFYMYCYVDCFGDKGRDVSDTLWTSLVEYFTFDDKLKMHNYSAAKQYSKNKVREKLKELDEERLVYKFSGEYYYSQVQGKKIQDSNRYYTRPDKETLDLYERYNAWKGKDGKPQLKDDDIIDTVLAQGIPVKEVKEDIVNTNWGKKEEYFGQNRYMDIDYWSYQVYRICKDYGIDQGFVSKCERTIEKKKEYGDTKFDEYERQYIIDKEMISRVAN